MLSIFKFFKKSPLMSAWHLTKNPEFVGAKDRNVVCYLNKNHILFSSKENYYVATPQMFDNELWLKLSNAFDGKTPTMETQLVEIADLNETCEQVYGKLTLEAETAGLTNII